MLTGLDGNLSINPNAYDKDEFCFAIKEINPGIYRTPGSPMNAERWHIDNPSPDQVKKMFDMVGCKMIWGLNMLTKGPMNNLNMLRYVASIGLPIDYVEFGNELNIFNSPGRVTFPTVDDYARTCRDWWTDIKAEFPNAIQLLVGENKGYKDTVHWNQSCLQYNPDAMLVWHYHTPAQYVFDGQPDIDVIRTCIDEEKENAFADVPIDKIAMTEFSVKQLTHEMKETVKFADAAAEELAITTMLTKFKEIGLPICCFHNVIGADDFGAILVSRYGSLLEPTGKAIKEFISAQI